LPFVAIATAPPPFLQCCTATLPFPLWYKKQRRHGAPSTRPARSLVVPRVVSSRFSCWSPGIPDRH
jgi:hypothetical protein